MPSTLGIVSSHYNRIFPVSLLLRGNGTNGAQNNTFSDSSSTPKTITRNGSVTQGSFSPFPLNGATYDPAIHGGSAYFDGSNNTNLVTPNIGSFSGDFTIELWTYQLTPTATWYPYIIGSNFPWNASGGIGLFYNASAGVADSTPIAVAVAGATISVGTYSTIKNRWVHIAIVRASGVVTVYLNGVSVGSANKSGTINTTTWMINGINENGSYGNHPTRGYIANFRIINGTALYTSNFSVPTSPATRISNGGATPSTDPTESQVSLLLNFTNGGVIDSVAKNNLVTVGNAQISTAVTKYGSGSLYFDGNGDYLTVPASNSFNFANGTPFTLEFWMNPLDYGSGTGFNGFRTIISTAQVYPAGWRIEVGSSAITFYTYSNGNTISIPISLNTWTHIAVVHDGTTTRMFKNGELAGSANPTWGASTSELVIGALMYGSYTYFYKGYIDDLRITRGAIYTENFAPGPLSELPTTDPINLNL